MTEAVPLTPGEFAARMEPLGPWGKRPSLAVAVSGGADSMALAVLAAGWSEACALVVDHGLRPDSAAEAGATLERLHARGIPTRLLVLRHLAGGPGLSVRARRARYAALTEACREAGIVHLLLGHQAADQAETRLMRAGRGSGPLGLAGMAAVSESEHVRLVRPLLTVAPERLRATLRAEGIGWVEDPTNRDTRFLRPRLRDLLGGSGPEADAARRRAAEAEGAGRMRGARERTLAARVGATVTFHPEGFALLPPAPEPDVLEAALRVVAGAGFPLPAVQVAALAASPRAATLGGARLLPAGRLGRGWIALREEAAMTGRVPARTGTVWDGRFQVAGGVPEGKGEIGALGQAAAALRDVSDLPAAVLRTLPAIWDGPSLRAVPHLGYRNAATDEDPTLTWTPPRPASGAPFLQAETPPSWPDCMRESA